MTKFAEAVFGVKGHFTLYLNKAGEEPRQVADFDNLITNIGLDAMAVGTFICDYCAVGSGSNTPVATDTGLQTAVARQRRNTPSTKPTTVIGASPTYPVSAVATIEFAQGAAAGNLTEIGVGIATGATAPNIKTYARSLIVDGSGNPTTITVLSDEFLTVTYTLTLLPPITDIVATIGSYTLTIRPANMTDITAWSAVGLGFCNVSGALGQLNTGVIAELTSSPSGTSINFSTAADSTYTAGTYYRDYTINWSPATGANDSQSIYIKLAQAGGGSNTNQAYQIGISPALGKTSSDVVTLNFRQILTRA